MHDFLILHTEILLGFSINCRREPPAKSEITQNKIHILDSRGERLLKLICDK